MSATTGSLGDRPTVELDGILLPLVGGSQIIRSPLNPFSPSSQAGNSARITDARLAVQVWDDFTGGLGQRDESAQGSTSYSEGTLDTRVPGAVALPPLQELHGTGSGFVLADRPVYVEHMRHATTPGLLIWSKKSAKVSVFRSNAFTARPAETVRGFAAYKGFYYYSAYTGTNTVIYRTADAGATWTTAATLAGKNTRGLVLHDNRLFLFNETDGTFQTSTDGATWTVHSTSPGLAPLETVRELFVWMEPSGARDTIFALTTQRILGYEVESTDWHEYYDFAGIFKAEYANVHKFRRDSNVYMAPCDDVAATGADKNGLVLMFNPQTTDEVGPTKRFGLPAGAVDGIMRMQGGVHWLYAWAAGTPGGVYALNEFQGWTQLFDPAVFGAALVVGGGYALGHIYTVTDDGRLYRAYIPDRRQLPPVSGVSYNTGKHKLRSSWTTHNQANRTKIGAYFEIDMRDATGLSGVPIGTVVTFRYRVDNGGWVTLTLGTSPGDEQVGTFLTRSLQPSAQVWPAIIPLPAGEEQTGAPYKRVQWEVEWERGGGATETAVLASVALYYTYWQESHYSYQFAVDLTWESWGFPDATVNGLTRSELQEALLSMVEEKKYHTFRYSQGALEEYVSAVDLLVAAREDSDNGGGVYNVTVRDLAVD